MCQQSKWSSLYLPGSRTEGWDLFFFVNEKWLYPSCAGAGARAAAKVLPVRAVGGTLLTPSEGLDLHLAFWGDQESDLCLVFLIILLLFKNQEKGFGVFICPPSPVSSD